MNGVYYSNHGQILIIVQMRIQGEMVLAKQSI